MIRASLVFFALALAACPPPALVVQRPYAAPRVEDVMAALKANAARIQSLAADARIEDTANGQRVKLGVELLVARPASLHFEAKVPLQGTVATLVADGRDFALLDSKNNKFFTGPAKGCNVARLIGIELEPEQVVSALLGGAPEIELMKPVKLDWDSSHGGRDVLTMDGPDGSHEKLFLDGRNNQWDLLGAERTDARGQLSWSIENEGWQDVGGVRRPGKTHVSQPPIKVEIWIRYKDQQPNFEPKEGVFQLQAPAGIPAQPVDC